MFYNKQTDDEKQMYKRTLEVMGKLSNLFSESDCPYLEYRAHENIFCKYFDAENLARSDCSADAKKGSVGIGLKTWTGSDDQKVAEFGRLKSHYEHLKGLELVRQIAQYRNDRIRTTMNLHGLTEMVYHIVRRTPNRMELLECPFDTIDIDKIKVINGKGGVNNTYFSDGNHMYHFSTSKNTLYMIFENVKVVDSFDVNIIEDPYSFMHSLFASEEYKMVAEYHTDRHSLYSVARNKKEKESICLPLYSFTRGRDKKKYVPLRSGLNQWNSNGRNRHPDEVYIPYQVKDRKRTENFFPDIDTKFNLRLPDGKQMSAKICQAGGKAIMSDPNKDLGHWLLRDVLDLKENTVVTYDKLLEIDIDSVIFTKESDRDYLINFARVGTYEEIYGEN